MLGQDPTEAGERFEQLAQDLERKSQRYQQLHQRLGTTTVSERSRNGEVTVTVDANGVLTHLELSERTRGMEPAAVSGHIMGCVRRAQARLREQVTELVYDTVGDDAPGNNLVRQYEERFPDPLDDDARPDRELSIGELADDAAGRREPPRRRPRRQDDEDDDMGGGSILR
jgi:DNA-binding protein YbaB